MSVSMLAIWQKCYFQENVNDFFANQNNLACH